jgi:hypothetical protein
VDALARQFVDSSYQKYLYQHANRALALEFARDRFETRLIAPAVVARHTSVAAAVVDTLDSNYAVALVDYTPNSAFVLDNVAVVAVVVAVVVEDIADTSSPLVLDMQEHPSSSQVADILDSLAASDSGIYYYRLNYLN